MKNWSEHVTYSNINLKMVNRSTIVQVVIRDCSMVQTYK